MERVGDIMERLGFNKEADDGVKAAFVKNLIKQAYGVEVPLPAQYEMQIQKKPNNFEELKPLSRNNLGEPQQLSFNLEDTSKVG